MILPGTDGARTKFGADLFPVNKKLRTLRLQILRFDLFLNTRMKKVDVVFRACNGATRGKRESRRRAHSRLPGDRPVPRRPERRALPPLRGQKKYVLHTIPSGVSRDRSVNVIGNGVVIDPVVLSGRDRRSGSRPNRRTGQAARSRKKAHLILPTHRAIDAASEAAKGKTKIGSTLKGIGPTYMDKTGRDRLRNQEISVSPEFRRTDPGG